MICHIAVPSKLMDISFTFCCLVISVKEKLNYRNVGSPIGDQTIHHIFADDPVIIAQDKEDAEYMPK